MAGRIDAWSWVVVDEVRSDSVLLRQISADGAAQRSELASWPEIGGSRLLVTPVEQGFRGWLVLSIPGRTAPSILLIGDEPHPSARTSRADPHQVLRTRAVSLLVRMRQLDDIELVELLEQDCGGTVRGHKLLSRMRRYASRPRLLAVDWSTTSAGAEQVRVPKKGQDDRYRFDPGAKVMIAGDGDPDVHAVVVSDEDDHWVVHPAWDAWDA